MSEVKQGFECGIGLEKYQDVKVGDVIEAFQVEKVAGESAKRGERESGRPAPRLKVPWSSPTRSTTCTSPGAGA